MTAVASAAHAAAVAQRDGRHYVTETFRLDDGTQRQSLYLADPGTDLDAHLVAMTAGLNAALAAAEAPGP